MVAELEQLMTGGKDAGVPELRAMLEELVGRQPGLWRFAGQESLRPPGTRVLRLRFANGRQTFSVVAKRLLPEIARRNALVAERWLPAVGLGDGGARLLGNAAAHSGTCIWQVYEDLGPHELNPRMFDPEAVKAAVDFIARLHVKMADHPLLGEIRLHGGDYGIHFYETSLRDATSALTAVSARGEEPALCERLLQRLDRLREETPERAQALADYGGPPTMLHGDLWAINVFILPANGGLQARLIDWDRAAVGPVSYDLSTFLLRFDLADRTQVLAFYRQALECAGWRLPATRELNLLFETAELARYASRIIWPAIALTQDGADWGFAELAEIEKWFENLAPVLPEQVEAKLQGAVAQ